MLTGEDKAKWLTALRSGKYEQTTGKLKCVVQNKYCCLGVLAEAKFGFVYNSAGDDDPITFVYKLNGEYKGVFAHMNDVEGKTFNEIADWIEKNVKTVEEHHA